MRFVPVLLSTKYSGCSKGPGSSMHTNFKSIPQKLPHHVAANLLKMTTHKYETFYIACSETSRTEKVKANLHNLFCRLTQ